MVNVTSTTRLSSVQLDEPVACAARDAIRGVVDRNLAAPDVLLASFARDFQQLIDTQV
jgi:hypothetical protein